ncbi:MAG: M23 family metallopeptidase [Bacteroidales bacterium]|nr:M23 family metallopeptidase [Bacteroidales bacterium]
MLTNEFQQLLDQTKNYESILESTYFNDDNLYRIILQLDTLPLTIRYGGTGGSSRDGINTLQSDISYQLERQIDKLDVQLQIQRNSFTTVYTKAVELSDRLKRLPAMQPVSKRDVLYISSYFGTRTDPFNHANEQIHTGIDFVAPLGVNVYATADGIVTLSQNSRTGYGNEIIIDHSFGYSTRYAHLLEILVKTGDQVKRGQLIGTLGSSGRSTGPHLHYEVRYENKAINPISFFEHNLSPDEYEEIIARANNGYY